MKTDLWRRNNFFLPQTNLRLALLHVYSVQVISYSVSLLLSRRYCWWHFVTFGGIWWHLLTFGGNLWHMYDLTLATLFNNSITFIKQVFEKISSENFWYMTFPYWTPFEFHCDTLYMFLRSVTHSLNGSCLDYRVPFKRFHFDQQCFVVLAREPIIRVTWYLIWVPPITLTISINMR